MFFPRKPLETESLAELLFVIDNCLLVSHSFIEFFITKQIKKLLLHALFCCKALRKWLSTQEVGKNTQVCLVSSPTLHCLPLLLCFTAEQSTVEVSLFVE